MFFLLTKTNNLHYVVCVCVSYGTCFAMRKTMIFLCILTLYKRQHLLTPPVIVANGSESTNLS